MIYLSQCLMGIDFVYFIYVAIFTHLFVQHVNCYCYGLQIFLICDTCLHLFASIHPSCYKLVTKLNFHSELFNKFIQI